MRAPERMLRRALRTALTSSSSLDFVHSGSSAKRTDVSKVAWSRTSTRRSLNKKFTQRGLRRTFNDLARAAEVQSLVTRSISGHTTTQMQEHYSTVNASEQRESIGKVIELMGVQSGAEWCSRWCSGLGKWCLNENGQPKLTVFSSGRGGI